MVHIQKKVLKKERKKKKNPAWSRGLEGLKGCEEFPEKGTWTLP